MTIQKSAVLDREYLEIRSKVLQLAAALDRVDRCSDTKSDDPRMAKLHEALQRVIAGAVGRAEAVQLIFSQSYRSNWRSEFGIPEQP